MKNFIAANKKLIILFLLFLGLTAASRIYIKNQSKNDSGINQPTAVENQNLPPESPTAPEKTISPPSQKNHSEQPTKPTASADISKNKATGQPHIFYINDAKYEISVPENTTVYELMNLLAQRGDIDFNGQNSSGLGFFVDEINGLKNNPSQNTYWIYYINGKAAQAGISNYVLKPDDIINWNYEKPRF